MKTLRLVPVIIIVWAVLSVTSHVINAAPAYTLTLKWQRCPAWYCETGWYASPAVADLDQDGQQKIL